MRLRIPSLCMLACAGAVLAGCGPTARFTVSTTGGEAPLEVEFEDDSATLTLLLGDATVLLPITSRSWAFGDGFGSTEENPTHIYRRGGTYTVSLTATNWLGKDTVIKEDLITVTEEAPTAAFTADVTEGDAPLEVGFTDQSTPGTFDITAWSWDFGDGAASTAQNPTHTYDEGGVYTVSLTVTTSAGTDTLVEEDLITVTVQPPEARFTVNPNSGEVPLTVQFTDLSIPGSLPIESWDWDFGDGFTSTAQNPSHAYEDPGTYTVMLTVTNAAGTNTRVKEDMVTTVLGGPDARFTADVTYGLVPLTVQFYDLSMPGSSPLVSWVWDFGDGEGSTQQSPQHTYRSTGNFTVTLTVANEDATGEGEPELRADTETKTEYIVVVRGPSAKFSTAATAEAHTLDFTDISTPGTSPITSWSWDFGDGDFSSQQNPRHTFPAAGTYTVTLEVTTAVDNDTRTKDIIVP